MESDIGNRETVYCADDDICKIDCDFCDNLCIQRYNKISLKPGFYLTKIRKKKQLLSNTRQIIEQSCFQQSKCV